MALKSNIVVHLVNHLLSIDFLEGDDFFVTYRNIINGFAYIRVKGGENVWKLILSI